MPTIEFVLDSTSILALLRGEPGGERVRGVLDRSVVGAPNYAEVLARLVRAGLSADEAVADADSLRLAVIPFDGALARAGVDLVAYGWTHGLSLGDRACLTLARHLGVPALTADRRWDIPGLPVQVRFVR